MTPAYTSSDILTERMALSGHLIHLPPSASPPPNCRDSPWQYQLTGATGRLAANSQRLGTDRAGADEQCKKLLQEL